MKIVDITENEPHKVSEVICTACRYRWIAVRPMTVKLKQLECNNCKRVGFVIETGEVLTDE
jgi:hypothetical protein